MNFIKNSWKSLFNKQQPKKNEQSKESNQTSKEDSQQKQQQIPLQILEQLFNLSAEFVKQSKKITNDATKLKIYGLFKQSKEGDCNTQKPQMFDLVGKSKWNAWNQLKGISKQMAMMEYVKVVSQADPQITDKISKNFSEAANEVNNEAKKHTQTGGVYKKVQAKDYSESYTHPYFKLIEKGQQIPNIEHSKLLQLNNEPAVYPLHFAIDKQRVDLVKQFMDVLTVEEIQGMKDSHSMTILEYAEEIQNQEILQLVQAKLKK